MKKKRFNSSSHIEKILILWVILKKFYWEKFNSSSHILKRVQFFEKYFEEGFNSVSRIEKSVQFCESYWKKDEFCGLASKRKFNSVSYFYWWKNFESWKKKGSISLNQKISKVQVSESCKKGSILWVISRKVQVLESWKKEGTMLSVKLSKKKSLVLWVIFSTKSSILWVISKKGSILLILWVFFNSILKITKKINSVSQLKKKSSIMWTRWKKFNSLSHV